MTRDEALALTRGASSRRTICEVLREIFDACEGRPKERELVLEALVMAKKMDQRLREYRSDWSVGFFGPNPDYKEDRLRRS